jgi:LuxR family maltose regulon positive regulatory protein
MDTQLLMTKVYAPPPRPGLVARPHLIERLNEGLRHGHKLTLVSAPAGFGKTTLLGAWVAGLERPVAWLSLDEGDNDPVRFLAYLIAALQTVEADIGEGVLDVLQSPRSPSPESLLTTLINDIAATSQSFILVLDDYHLVEAQSIHKALTFLLTHLPLQMHIVIATRHDPPLPLIRWRARAELNEFRVDALRFSTAEMAVFLTETFGLQLEDREIEALEARTEGWITALQLAGLALQAQDDAGEFIATFTGEDRYIMDYLIKEVLIHQPQHVRNFLQETAIFDRLSAPLCDAITGRDDSQTLLEQLDQNNLFVSSLDNRREWYRYHPLFTDVLRTRIDPLDEQRLHMQAVRWYEVHGYPHQAIQHALIYASLTGDPSEAAQLIVSTADEVIRQGTLVTVQRWLDAIPDEYVRSDWELATYVAWLRALRGDMLVATDYAQAARSAIQPETTSSINLGKLYVVRGYIAVFGLHDYEAALEWISQALETLGEDKVQWRAMALWVLAEAQERVRPITEAIATYRHAQRVGRELGVQFYAGMVEAWLATALNHHGRRREAVAICQSALDRFAEDREQVAPAASPICVQMGNLYYDANQLDEAWECFQQAVQLAGQLGLDYHRDTFAGLSAPVLHALGRTEEALVALQQAYQRPSAAHLQENDWFQAWEVNLCLQKRDLAFVRQWIERQELSVDGSLEYLRIETHLAFARALIALERQQEARQWLDRLERFTTDNELHRALITVHILKALLAELGGDRSDALDSMARAVELAAPEEYYRLFLNEDVRAMELLNDVRGIAPTFVDRLLYMMASDPAQEFASQPLFEPLSDRELEVLALIARGLTNREIGEQLYIAIGTVKRHTNNIYGKLNVSNRTKAVAKARELRLI